MILTICNFECLHKAVIYCIIIRARHIFRNIYFRKKPKAKRGVLKFAYQHISAYMKQSQIKVRFECRVKKKFLAALNLALDDVDYTSEEDDNVNQL